MLSSTPSQPAVYLRLPIHKLLADYRYTTANLEVRGAFFGLLCLLRTSERPGWLPRFLVASHTKGTPTDSRQGELAPDIFAPTDTPRGPGRVDIDWVRLAQILGGTPERVHQAVGELIRNGLFKVDGKGELHDPDIAATAEREAALTASRRKAGTMSGAARRAKRSSADQADGARTSAQ